ncbi:Potassium channel subfamily K member 9 [Frankliniella fusca]|uniref:Potassium channel subfamily K member 9 n=1 Tax=Frankliniella fusca TaxID=407009 RepID=A0AAE1GX70_9NEOP|nr:Potassium channel subfamily K member 9 [Frankliniella fusca]
MPGVDPGLAPLSTPVKRAPPPPPRRYTLPPPPPPSLAAMEAAAAAAAAAEAEGSPPVPRVPVYLVLLGLAVYICLGAAVFAAWEEWSFLDGAYFCFVTLSTIGFGDLVPGKSLKSAESQGGQLQVSACVAYLLLGLVLIATAFSLVQEEVLARLSQVARTLGIISKHHQPQARQHQLQLHRRPSGAARQHQGSQTAQLQLQALQAGQQALQGTTAALLNPT